MCITKNGVVRGKSWTRQTLSDAWNATNCTACVARRGKWWAPDLKLTKKVTTDEEGAGPLLLRIVAEKFQRPTQKILRVVC